MLHVTLQLDHRHLTGWIIDLAIDIVTSCYKLSTQMVDTLVTGTSNVFYYYRYSITIIDYQVTGTSNVLFYYRYYSTMMDTLCRGNT